MFTSSRTFRRWESIETWARQTRHADGITWFLSKLEAEARADPDSELVWSVPTARSDRAYNWGGSAITPDAVGQMTAQGLQIPFYFEYELRARHPRGVIARLDPYEDYYHFPGEFMISFNRLAALAKSIERIQYSGIGYLR